MKVEDGGYICLVWDGSSDAYYVKGHVSNKEGLAVLRDEGVVDDNTTIGHAKQIYGRWSIEPGEDGNHHVLREYNIPGRGHFKITRFGILENVK